jgi:hypothetical protein
MLGVRFHKKNISTTTRTIHVWFCSGAWGVLFRGYFMCGRVVPSLWLMSDVFETTVETSTRYWELRLQYDYGGVPRKLVLIFWCWVHNYFNSSLLTRVASLLYRSLQDSRFCCWRRKRSWGDARGVPLSWKWLRCCALAHPLITLFC